MGFGKQLKEVLDELDMSVATLSRKTEIPSTTLYSIISKDIENVGLDKVKKIEKAVCAIPGGIIYNLLYGIEQNQESVSTRQYDFSNFDEEYRQEILDEIFSSLTLNAQVKILEYAEDLNKIPEYRKDNE